MIRLTLTDPNLERQPVQPEVWLDDAIKRSERKGSMKWRRVGEGRYTSGRFEVERLGRKNWVLRSNGEQRGGRYRTKGVAQQAAESLGDTQPALFTETGDDTPTPTPGESVVHPPTTAADTTDARTPDVDAQWRSLDGIQLPDTPCCPGVGWESPMYGTVGICSGCGRGYALHRWLRQTGTPAAG